MPTTLVTGANRGLGREVAVQLGALGHHVMLGVRDVGAGREVADQIGGAGGSVEVLQLDLSDTASIDAAVAAISSGPGLDVLVNNAAITYDTWQSASEPDFEVVRTALETNLFGTWRLTAALIPVLTRSTAGRIVNVSSGASRLGSPGEYIDYAASKGAIDSLTIGFRRWMEVMDEHARDLFSISETKGARASLSVGTICKHFQKKNENNSSDSSYKSLKEHVFNQN